MSEIRAGTTSTTALVTTGDTTGNLVLTPDSGIATISATGALRIPVGTTAQRPASPTNGMTRMNTTTGTPEWYSTSNSVWTPFSDGLAYTVEYLTIAGGGGVGPPYALYWPLPSTASPLYNMTAKLYCAGA